MKPGVLPVVMGVATKRDATDIEDYARTKAHTLIESDLAPRPMQRGV
jgi:hypothetical protein